MHKSLTKREKTMLLILIAVLIVIGYTKIILANVNKKVDDIDSMTAIEQAAIDSNIARSAQLENMKNVLAKAKKDGIKKSMPLYDSSAELIVELNSILSASYDYSIDYGKVVKTDNLVKRPVTMVYKTDTYDDAAGILKTLRKSRFKNQIADVTFEVSSGNSRTEATVFVNFFENVK